MTSERKLGSGEQSYEGEQKSQEEKSSRKRGGEREKMMKGGNHLGGGSEASGRGKLGVEVWSYIRYNVCMHEIIKE